VFERGGLDADALGAAQRLADDEAIAAIDALEVDFGHQAASRTALRDGRLGTPDFCERAMLVIAIPIGTIITVGVIGWIVINVLLAGRRRKRLQRLREKQEAARLRALEKALRPPLLARLRLPFRKPK
jgi:hypothetical protein